ncbi:hypothetical protein AB0C10_31940 [Microbispora amethystogenes]
MADRHQALAEADVGDVDFHLARAAELRREARHDPRRGDGLPGTG